MISAVRAVGLSTSTGACNFHIKSIESFQLFFAMSETLFSGSSCSAIHRHGKNSSKNMLMIYFPTLTDSRTLPFLIEHVGTQQAATVEPTHHRGKRGSVPMLGPVHPRTATAQ